jgi:O-antigen ligase
MVALGVAALAVGFMAAGTRARWVLAAGTAALVLAGAGIVFASVRGDSAQRFTSGRSELVEGAARVFVDHPVVGVGLGSQPKASREAGGRRETSRNASHTTPLTVAAEGGVVGLALYVVFLLGSAVLLAGVHRVRPVLGLGLAGVFIVLFVHSLLYSGFFQDPLTWGILALGASALAVQPRRVPATAPEPSGAAITATPVRGRWQT